MEWVVRVNKYLYLDENQTDFAKFRPGAQFADGVSECLKISQTKAEGPPVSKSIGHAPAGSQAPQNGKAVQKWKEDDCAWEKQGFTLLLSGRPKGGQAGAPERLFHVPLSESEFKPILEDLRVHKHIVRVLERGSTYMSAAEVHVRSSTSSATKGLSATPGSSQTSSVRDRNKAAAPALSDEEIVYTAFFESGTENYKGNLAFTSTHFAATKSSCGIILGCIDSDMDRVKAMLAGCETTWDHPLLLPSIFAELQRRRLRDLSEHLNTRAFRVLADLEDDIEKLSQMSDDSAVENSLKWATDLGRVQNDSNLIGEDLAAASRQLDKWVIHATALLASDEESKLERRHDTRRVVDRFQEIGLDLQDLMASCRVNVSEAVLTAEGFQNDLARRQARANASQTKQASLQTQASTIIAFAAMLYLPISTMASIFAMPVFDFKAAWRDLMNRPAQPSDSAGEPQVTPSSSSTLALLLASATESTAATATIKPPDNPSVALSPVVSVYLWYYLASTVALMLVTFEVWYWHTHPDRPRRQRTLTSAVVTRAGQGLAKNCRSSWRHLIRACSPKNKTKQPILPVTQLSATESPKSSGTPPPSLHVQSSSQTGVSNKASG